VEKRFVILDRDGAIVVARTYFSNPEQVELVPNAISGLEQVRDKGLGLVLVTIKPGRDAACSTLGGSMPYTSGCSKRRSTKCARSRSPALATGNWRSGPRSPSECQGRWRSISRKRTS
jgi:hypothetical protein